MINSGKTFGNKNHILVVYVKHMAPKNELNLYGVNFWKENV